MPETFIPEDITESCPVCGMSKSSIGFWLHVQDCAAHLRAELTDAQGPPEPSRPTLTQQQKAAAREEMKAQGGPCPHCGGLHSRACPRVKRVKWDGGKPVEAVYWRDGRWPTDSILFPEDIAEDDEDEEGTL